MEITKALQGTDGYQILINFSSDYSFFMYNVRPLFADMETNNESFIYIVPASS